MREYQIQIQKALAQGLRPHDDIGRNKEYLVTSQYITPFEYGLRSTRAPTNPFGGSMVDLTWPFPQLFRTAADTFLAYSTALYSVTEDTPWLRASSAYTLYDLNNPDTSKTISGTDLWHLARLPKGWIITNGTTTVFKLAHETMFGEPQVIYAQDEVPVNSCCYSRGRVVLGGVRPTILLKDDWRSIFGHWLDSLPYSINVDFAAPDLNCVYWSSIGGGDVLLPFAPELVADGHLAEDKVGERDREFFMELLQRNELGFMPMPWRGDVYVVKELGQGVAVYCENGIAVLTPVGAPASTYGLRIIADFGVAGRNAVGGDEHRHLFVDGAGNAWTLDADFVLRKLDYKEFLSPIVDDVVVNYDPEYDTFYMASNADTCYVYTPQGLGQSPYTVRSCLHTGANLLGIFDTVASTEAVMVTDVVDFNFRDLKTITTVEVGAATTGTLSVAVDYRYQRGAAWVRSSWVTVNTDGFARLQITAEEFRVAVKCSTYDDLELDYINVRWQPSGRRTVRGVNAATTDN